MILMTVSKGFGSAQSHHRRTTWTSHQLYVTINLSLQPKGKLQSVIQQYASVLGKWIVILFQTKGTVLSKR